MFAVRLHLVFAALLLVPVPAVQAAQLKPFTSDGCSSFPNGTREDKELWLQCCRAHDFAYWKGGTKAERRQADAELQSCVAELGKPAIATLMKAGVRVGGSPYWPTKFRWGYGWPWPHFYRVHNADELEQIEAAIKLLPPQLEK